MAFPSLFEIKLVSDDTHIQPRSPLSDTADIRFFPRRFRNLQNGFYDWGRVGLFLQHSLFI
jgi:hypothetical protein